MKKPLGKNKKGKLPTKYCVVIACLSIVLLVSSNSAFAQNARPDKGLFVAETVKSGTTFYDLAQKHYGNRTFWVYIYLANKSDIPYPDDLRTGMSVVIPQAEALGIDANDTVSVAKAAELAKETEKSYLPSNKKEAGWDQSPKGEFVSEIVKPGETFRTLALKYYGDKEFWVYIFLANKSNIPHPNKLNYGKTVVIPSASSSGIDANNPASVAKARELGRKAMSESN